jgi:asparagine synthase (glutamine-hydrolysing)
MIARRFAGTFRAGEPLALAVDGVALHRPEPVCLLSGRLDNHAALAAELGRPGAEAAGEEATLLAGFRRWGAELVPRLRGDFALLIWNPAAARGLLARDQMGIRPLYLAAAGGRLAFATEVRGLLALLDRRPAPDRLGVAHWITATHRPGTGTLYEGVERLGPGELVELGADGTERRRYWRPVFRQPLASPADELATRARAALELSVRRRLSAEADTGVLMSGGLDSSSVAAVAAAAEMPVSAFSARFPDHPAADESELIAELRDALGIGGVTASVRTGGLLESALDYQAASGMPLIGWGDFWTRPLLAAAAAAGVGTMLDGDGGDEIFGPRVNLVADRIRAGRPGAVRAALRRLPGAGQVPRSAVIGLLARQGLVAMPSGLNRAVERRRDRRQTPAWLAPDLRRGMSASTDPVPWRRLDGPLWWSEAAWTVAEGMDQVGVFEHHANRELITGVAPAHPMLDLDLVELCLATPPDAGLDPRYSRPLLRAAVAGALPDAVRLRPAKAHFESLIADCLAGPDDAAIRALLLDPGARLGEYVDRRRLARDLVDGGAVERGSFRWMWLMWRSVTAELWLRGEEGGAAALPPTSAPQVELTPDSHFSSTSTFLRLET